MKFIKFIPSEEVIVPKDFQPVPSKKLIPDWYKKSELTVDSGSHGLKACIPYLDGMISGYSILLSETVYIKRDSDGKAQIYIEKSTSDGQTYLIESVSAVEERSNESGPLMPRPNGYGPEHFVWKVPVAVKTPKGWSTVFTHPLNRYDLPFITLSAIVDTDKFSSHGNVPFFLQSGFEGIIPAGTPICQIMPIKRASWVSTWEPHMSKKINDLAVMVRSYPLGGYKKLYWQRKEFN